MPREKKRLYSKYLGERNVTAVFDPTAVEIGDSRYWLKEVDFKDFTDFDLENLEEWVTNEIDNRYNDKSPPTKLRIEREELDE